jgi:hypothetical protein
MQGCCCHYASSDLASVVQQMVAALTMQFAVPAAPVCARHVQICCVGEKSDECTWVAAVFHQSTMRTGVDVLRWSILHWGRTRQLQRDAPACLKLDVVQLQQDVLVQSCV